MDANRFTAAVNAAGPSLLFGLRLWASVCLALFISFWLELDNAYWAGTTAAIVCQPQLGASLRKGWFRMIGTLVGAVAIVTLTACFPQDRTWFLVGLALWGAACALAATFLRNFAAYAAALAGFTAAIIASDQLGAVGGVNGDAFTLAVTRASEICIGIVCAGIVLAGTDLGAARHRLAGIFAELAARIMAGFIGALALAGSELADTQPVRREFIRRVVALEPIIDQTLGESAEIRYHSPVLQRAVDGLFAALSGWRVVANRLARLSGDAARREAAAILADLPNELRSLPDGAGSPDWTAGPVAMRQICESAARRLIDLPLATASLRLLADNTAEALAGMAEALNGLALLVADPARSAPRRASVFDLRLPDWLPPLVNAGRAFVTIGAVMLFWILTAWPNGAQAITFAAITATLFAPRADQAYATVVGYMVGTVLTAVFAAIIGFAVLPKFDTFAGFAIAIGMVLVPSGAGMTQPWQTTVFNAMAANFVPLLAPANQMNYDAVQFYNAALAVAAGIGTAALAFRLMPPLSPTYRARRLLMLTLRDLRRLATRAASRPSHDWKGHIYARLAVLPDEAQPVQRAQLLAALSVGDAIIDLRRISRELSLTAEFDAALAAMARSDIVSATTRLVLLDAVLAARPGAAVPRARANILALSEALTQHPDYFGTGTPA